MPTAVTLRLETVEGEGLRFGADSGSGQHTVVDSGPGMVAPNPIEMLLVALGGCEAMDVISILRKKRQRVTGYEVRVSGERRTEHPKGYTRMEILHRVTGHDVSPEAVERAIELSHTKYCSVQATLDPAIPVINRFEIVPA